MTVNYQFMTIPESRDHLKAYHSRYTNDCCPDLAPEWAMKKNEDLQSIVGSYPVITSSKATVMDKFSNICSGGSIEWDVSWRIRNIMESLTDEEYFGNQLSKERFEELKSYLKDWNEKANEHNLAIDEKRLPEYYGKKSVYELIKHNSPKLANIFLSLLKWRGYEAEEAEKHSLIIQFNNRGGNKAEEKYELIISTEPHRIAGMSAFGKFGSCQDWIDKEDTDHKYHTLAHQAWANLADSTCGIAFIRAKSDIENHPEYSRYLNSTGLEDMLARSLVRVFRLDNGHVMVLLHRIYAMSPFDKYLSSSFEAWEKTLPDNWHVLRLYNYTPKNVTGKTRSGREVSGRGDFEVEAFTTELKDEKRCACDSCSGIGKILCNVCDGTGRVYLYDSEDNEYRCTCKECDGDGNKECPDCEGNGWMRDSDGELEPYNDHDDWFIFSGMDACITFFVPRYIMEFEDVVNEESEEATA